MQYFMVVCGNYTYLIALYPDKRSAEVYFGTDCSRLAYLGNTNDGYVHMFPPKVADFITGVIENPS